MIKLDSVIKQKLIKEFNSQDVDVLDESFKHIGHAGARPEGETHFSVTISSDKFAGLNRVKQHQLVYDCLDDLIGNPIHALAIKTSLPK